MAALLKRQKPIGGGDCGVVTRRPAQNESPSALLLHGGIDGDERGSRRQARNFERLRTDAGVGVKV
jgi:hypothetical protein